MSDINQIIAGGAGAGTTADFSGIPKILDYFYKGRDEAAKNDLRNVFKDGVPTGPDGQPDFAAMGKALFQQGDIASGTSLSNLDLQRQQLKLGQDASAKMGQMESGGQPPQGQPVLPPSVNRSGSAVVAPPVGNNQPQPGAPQQPQGATLIQVLAAQGIPNDQLGAAAASVGRQLGLQDPSQPLNLQDPQVRNVLVPAIQRLKQMGIGQVQPPQGQPQQAPQSAPPPQPQQAPQQVAQPQQQPGPLQVAQAAPPQQQPNPQANQGTFGAPSAIATRGAIPTGTDPEIQKQIATYTAIASNPAYPKQVQEAALARLKALQDQGQPTGPMKEYDLARRQGYEGTFQDFAAENEAKKTAATEDAKLGAQKYQAIIDNGTKAQQEIPQLQMLQTEMNDPNFYSGVGEKYNLLAKRLKSAVGIDPDAAVPQEFLRKATAANVLSSLGALKGLGQIRVAEINMAREAAASPENSVPANKLLTEISLRTHQRNADIADMAQSYKEKNGVLDAGFDKLVTQYGRQHPLFSDSEIKDFHNVIGTAKTASAAPSAAPKFNSPADVHAAVAAGTLKKGQTFTDPNGVQRIVP